MQRNEDIYDSYINANFINTSASRNDQLFIAAQGPLLKTTENFWRMCQQEHVNLIVMLTATKEHGKQKCDHYWPMEVEDVVEFDDTYVRLVSVESIMPNLIKRKLLLGEEQREITHVQYLTWPDHGAPEEQDFAIIAVILQMMEEFHKRDGPSNKIVLHCSAGIGRTGSLIAIYNLQLTAKTLQSYLNKCKFLQISTFV